MEGSDVPVGIDRDRHHRLVGRAEAPWGRRAALLLIAAVPVLGLLNVFGQRSNPTTADSTGVSLLVDSPSHVRGGLVFTTQLVILPHRDLNDAKLYLDRGWFQAMTLNGVAPQPSNQDAQGRWEVWDFGQLSSGTPFRVWVSWQTNPTNIGRHPQYVQIYDGDQRLVAMQRNITVFP